MKIRIGTRGSLLALAQCEWVKGKIRGHHPGLEVELVRIKTQGDKILDAPLSKIGGKGLFVKEIEEALLSGRVDLAVHSMKDVPAELPDGLLLTAFPEREDPRDVLISVNDIPLHELPQGALLGTSSLRRGAQVRHFRPDLEIVPLRGNVDTRIRKLGRGDFHAIVLAAAGMARLGLKDQISQVIPTERVLPAIGQGALGIEVRGDNSEVIEILSFMDHGPTAACVMAERGFLKKLEGGCQVPIAGLAALDGRDLHLEGMVAELDGSRVIRDKMKGDRDLPEELGISLAERMLEAGAGEILARIYEREEADGDGKP